MTAVPFTLCLLLPLIPGLAQAAAGLPAMTDEHIVEWTITSQKRYADPFNDVEVDVIFSKGSESWRIPTFWHGGQQWTVRFAAPAAGEYAYRLQSTDKNNPDLNGHEGRVKVTPYRGSKELLRHGPVRVSANKRYFEHADGTPFYWLGDTWWAGLSGRLSWEGFQKLTADRKAKGFTVVQLVGGLVPYEELAPSDPGFCNEGGCVWDSEFKRINPKYFDYADRRIQHLLGADMAPAIVGAWDSLLVEMGSIKLKQHWRYLIARYGAYPVFWIVGGEIIDPPPQEVSRFPAALRPYITPGWTDIARYIRATDPYHRPLTIHEAQPPADFPSEDERLTDFDLFQSSHNGWASIATEVAQMNMHYARTTLIKPIVQGEIGYENLGEQHHADFQRAAFWLSMLNGAAGHTYGANGTFESYTADKPLHRIRWSFMSWEEGMSLPGSYQIGLASKLLRQYRWWQFQPHPEWVTPRGTTLLEPRPEINGFDLGERSLPEGKDFPAGLWKAQGGDFHNPYAAGIPGEVRLIYMASFGLRKPTPPTVLGLEPSVRYEAYLWEPTQGIRIDLGAVERPTPDTLLFQDSLDRPRTNAWKVEGKGLTARRQGGLSTQGDTLTILENFRETNLVATVEARSEAQAALVLRYQDADHYIAAMYAADKHSLYLLEHRKGEEPELLGATPIAALGPRIKLSAEVRDDKGIVSVTDGARTYTTPIVDLRTTAAGRVGLLHSAHGTPQRFGHFELRRSPVLVEDESLQRKLYDARGSHRGSLVGAGMDIGTRKEPGWDEFGRDKHILLDAYRPERFPTSGDWVLVLETQKSRSREH